MKNKMWKTALTVLAAAGACHFNIVLQKIRSLGFFPADGRDANQ